MDLRDVCRSQIHLFITCSSDQNPAQCPAYAMPELLEQNHSHSKNQREQVLKQYFSNPERRSQGSPRRSLRGEDEVGGFRRAYNRSAEFHLISSRNTYMTGQSSTLGLC